MDQEKIKQCIEINHKKNCCISCIMLLKKLKANSNKISWRTYQKHTT